MFLIPAVDQFGFGIEAVFSRRGDRYAHAIVAVTPSERWTVLQSLESDGDSEPNSPEPWPPSPPLQQLSMEDRVDGRRVALLLGMAGRSHWSLVVEANSQQRSLTFEAACRVQHSPTRLGSSYQHVAPLAAGVDASSESPIWTPPPPGSRFESPDHAIVQGSAVDGQSRLADGQWRLMPTPQATGLPYTATWKYQLRLRETN